MLNSQPQNTLDMIYPKGALYLSMNNTNPELLFGGKWKQLTADAYLKIVTSGAGETAKGNTDHKITVDQMPSHTHNSQTCVGWGTGGGNSVGRVTSNNGDYNGWPTTIYNTGGGKAYYPGYIGIYVWYRTA